jgi:hypothetical protein
MTSANNKSPAETSGELKSTRTTSYDALLR